MITLKAYIVKQFEKPSRYWRAPHCHGGISFNPELHNAVSMEEGGDGKEVVSEELRAGYQLGDHVIRHAMVRLKAR